MLALKREFENGVRKVKRLALLATIGFSVAALSMFYLLGEVIASPTEDIDYTYSMSFFLGGFLGVEPVQFLLNRAEKVDFRNV